MTWRFHDGQPSESRSLACFLLGKEKADANANAWGVMACEVRSAPCLTR